MEETKSFLSLSGLKSYDKLIKQHIETTHENKEVLDGIDVEKVAYWDSKQDIISDLDDIRSGAAAGAAALDGAKDYADSLSINYDAAGAAAQSLTDAKDYVDGKGYATITQVDAKVDKDELKDYALKTDIKETIAYTSGDNIKIENNVISAKGYSTNDGGNSISVGVNNNIIVDDGGNNGVNGMCCGSDNTLKNLNATY